MSDEALREVSDSEMQSGAVPVLPVKSARVVGKYRRRLAGMPQETHYVLELEVHDWDRPSRHVLNRSTLLALSEQIRLVLEPTPEDAILAALRRIESKLPAGETE